MDLLIKKCTQPMATPVSKHLILWSTNVIEHCFFDQAIYLNTSINVLKTPAVWSTIYLSTALLDQTMYLSSWCVYQTNT
jgi:hypothetical protein